MITLIVPGFVFCALATVGLQAVAVYPSASMDLTSVGAPSVVRAPVFFGYLPVSKIGPRHCVGIFPVFRVFDSDQGNAISGGLRDRCEQVSSPPPV